MTKPTRLSCRSALFFNRLVSTSGAPEKRHRISRSRLDTFRNCSEPAWSHFLRPVKTSLVSSKKPSKTTVPETGCTACGLDIRRQSGVRIRGSAQCSNEKTAPLPYSSIRPAIPRNCFRPRQSGRNLYDRLDCKGWLVTVSRLNSLPAKVAERLCHVRQPPQDAQPNGNL